MVVTVIEGNVVLSNEDITQDPESTRRNINTSHSEQADTFTSVDNVISTRESESMTAEGESDGGERGDLGAIDGVFGGVQEERSSTNESSNGLDISGRTSEQRGTSVEDSTSGGGGRSGTNVHGIEVSLPVSGGGQRNPSEGTSEVSGIVTTESQFTRSTRGRGQVETENGGGDGTLVEQSAEDSGDTIDGDGFEGHTEDTIELTDGVSQTQTRSISDFSEFLLSSSQATEVNIVEGQETRDRAGTVLDLEDSAVSNVSRRSRRLVERMRTAVGTSGRGQPQVRRTSVEDDIEGLSGVTDGDGTIVLSVFIVRNDNVTSTSSHVLGEGVDTDEAVFTVNLRDGLHLVEGDADQSVTGGHEGNQQ